MNFQAGSWRKRSAQEWATQIKALMHSVVTLDETALYSPSSQAPWQVRWRHHQRPVSHHWSGLWVPSWPWKLDIVAGHVWKSPSEYMSLFESVKQEQSRAVCEESVIELLHMRPIIYCGRSVFCTSTSWSKETKAKWISRHACSARVRLQPQQLADVHMLQFVVLGSAKNTLPHFATTGQPAHQHN